MTIMFDLSKLSTELLSQSFSGDEWPLFKRVALNGEQLEVDLDIPENLCFFAGHFPEQAVLPGIVQIHWAGELAKFLLKVEGFIALKNIKFNSMVLPNTQLKLVLKYNKDKQTLRFDYSSEIDKFSSGLLAFSVKQVEL